MDGDLMLNITFPKLEYTAPSTSVKKTIVAVDPFTKSKSQASTKKKNVKTKNTITDDKKKKSPKKISKDDVNKTNKKSEIAKKSISSFLNLPITSQNAHDATETTFDEVTASDSVKTKRVQRAVVNPVPRSRIFAGNPEIPNLQCLIEPIASSKSIYNSNNPFSDLDILPRLKTYITEKMNIQYMTDVQAKSLPVLLSGKDALITAETGSGKTLAYAIPIVQSLQAIDPPIKRSDGPRALVFAPTRELALQCYEVINNLTQSVIRIVPTCLIGGQKRKSEKARIRKGVNIIVSTPGRFIDHLDNTCCMSLENVQWLIFDEADRLLDMNFQYSINQILAAVKQQSKHSQQVVLLSATLTPGVEKLVDLSLNDPVRIEIHPEKKADFMFIESHSGLKVEKASLPSGLTQFVVLVPMKIRLVSLLAFIHLHCVQSKEKLLVFLSCRDSVAFHHDILSKCKFPDYNHEECTLPIFQLHGGMTQQERTAAVQKFKKVESGVVFCTDVAARGLDIPNLHWVIQYDSPGSPVNYIHRVGRTARAGNKGNALLYLSPSEAPYAYLLAAFDIAVSELKLSSIISDVVNYKLDDLSPEMKIQQSQEIAGSVHSSVERQVQQDASLKESAKKAYLSFIRAYATYPPSLKKVFHVRNLHLGHVAKSFALTESPGEISGEFRNLLKRKAKHGDFQAKHTRVTRDGIAHKTGTFKPRAFNAKSDTVSEFSSGLERVIKKRKLL